MSKMDHEPIVTPALRGQGGSGAGGIQLSCDTTSKAAVLPTDASGNRPKYIRIATTGNGYVRMHNATTVAVVTDVLFTAGMKEFWPVGDATHVAYVSAVGTTICNVFAIEFG